MNPVMAFFTEQGLSERVREFDVSSATVELAAQAVGCQPEQIAKTLSFQAEDGCVLIVAAGDARIDNGKYKSVFGRKAAMLSREDVPALTGHPVGGVCPFLLKDGVLVYLDSSLKRFDVVYAACGSPNSAVGLTPEELHKLSNAAGWIDVCKDWQLK